MYFVKHFNYICKTMKETKDYKAIRLEKSQIKLIKNLADKLGINFSQATRMIINKYFKQ